MQRLSMTKEVCLGILNWSDHCLSSSGLICLEFRLLMVRTVTAYVSLHMCNTTFWETSTRLTVLMNVIKHYKGTTGEYHFTTT